MKRFFCVLMSVLVIFMASATHVQAEVGSGGLLAKDSNWKDYASKNMTTNLFTGSVFTNSSIWTLVSFAELIVIFALILLLIKKKKA